jgi:hypothetical protein
MAHETLGCGALGDLTAAVDDPLSWSRFWKNVWLAPTLTWIRIPQDIQDARDKFCHSVPEGPRPQLHLRTLPGPGPGPVSVPPEEPADSEGTGAETR